MTVLDNRLPVMTGVEAFDDLRVAAPHARIVFWTSAPREELPRLRMLPCAAVVSKHDSLDALHEAIRGEGV